MNAKKLIFKPQINGFKFRSCEREADILLNTLNINYNFTFDFIY